MRRRLTCWIVPAMAEPVRNHGGGDGSCGNHHHNSHSHSQSHGHHHHHHQLLESDIKGYHLRQCQLATLVGGATNVLFSLTKMWFGTRGGSVALVADGFHALVDLLADTISYVTLTLSVKKFPRCRFPFGIGRIETTGAVVVAFILLLGGVTLLFQSLGEFRRELLPRISGDHDKASSFQDHAHHELSHTNDTQQHSGTSTVRDHHDHSHVQLTQLDDEGRVKILWTMVFVSVVSIVAKEFLFRWTKRVGEKAGSRVTVANAYHHRADAWSAAVALAGVGGHCIGIPGIDGLAGLAVSYSICRLGYNVLRSSLLEFFDFQSADEVSSVRHALKQYEKIPLINAFLIRHGHSYALHVTLLVEAETRASSITVFASELTDLAKQSIAVRDTYATLFVYDKNRETSLRDALKIVEEFHGLKSVQCDWENKRVIIHQHLHNECLEDINTVSSLFGVEVVMVDDTTLKA